MTKRFLKIVGASALLAAAFSITAFADTAITNVKFQCGADTDASITPGVTSPVFVLNDADAHYTLSSYSEANADATNYKSPRVYELTFDADEGYYFAASNSITVEGKGITAITNKKVDSGNNTTLTVKAKAYPYYCWETPSPVLSDDGKKLSWDSVGSGATYEYLIVWTDYKGEVHNVHSSTTKTSVNTSSYVKEKPASVDKDGELGYADANEINSYAVRAKGSAGENTRTCPGAWSDPSVLSNFDNVEDQPESWGDLFEGVVEVGGTGGVAGGSGNYGPGKGNAAALTGWQQGKDGAWYYYNNGNVQKGWLWDGSHWYYLDPASGIMKTGWIIDNNKRYYLNPNAGGPMGAMVTGTQVIDGQTVTFDATGAAM